MRVLFVASECAPLVKVGGLADVVGGLPKALVKMGVEVSIALPFYESIKVSRNQGIKELGIKYNKKEEKLEVFQTTLPETEIPVFLFKNETYLSKGPIYNAKSAEGSDLDYDRFSFFSKAVVEFINNNLEFDFVHCHDWHASWLPLLLKEKRLELKTLLTIHNMGKLYQGIADKGIVKKLGLAIDDGKWKIDSDTINILLQGIIYADFINTVSPTYAKEIQTEEFGEGLEEFLRQKKDKLLGILNGIDYEVWNPATDKYLTTNFQYPISNFQFPISNWQEGKKRNKFRLLETVGLPQGEKIPLFSMVTRVAEQKGFDILIPVLEQLLGRHSGEPPTGGDSRIDSGQARMTQDLRVIILGTGDPVVEDRLKKIEARFFDKLKFITRFDENLAHLIYAGSDFFLMPSRFEPSGLGQLIAMRYGTLPIARKVGGLADSVEDQVTGFVFEEYASEALFAKLEEVIRVYRHSGEPPTGGDSRIGLSRGKSRDSGPASTAKRGEQARMTQIEQMVNSVMQKDFSWDKSAGEYLKLYQKLFKE